MERSTTSALHGAVLVTLLLGVQAAATQATLPQELRFDAHGRIVGQTAATAFAPGEDDGPGSVPNIKC